MSAPNFLIRPAVTAPMEKTTTVSAWRIRISFEMRYAARPPERRANPVLPVLASSERTGKLCTSPVL
jgi:hypothetical protein